MDIMSIIGLILAPLLIIFGAVFNMPTETIPMGIQLSKLANFLDYPSIAVTIGGTIAVLMLSFPISYFAKIGKHLKIIFKPQKFNPLEYIDSIVEFAKEARSKGLLSLEDKLSQTKEPFLKNSLMLVVDSVDPEKVKELLDSELQYLDDRHARDRALYEKGGAFAPAFGMLGTLIGLVNMLQNMADPDSIGPAMAVALLTTFYGSVFANVIFIPIATKLAVRHEEEYLCKMLICEGVQAIQAGENPKFINEKLLLLLPASIGKGGKGSKAEKGKKDKKNDAKSEPQSK